MDEENEIVVVAVSKHSDSSVNGRFLLLKMCVWRVCRIHSIRHEGTYDDSLVMSFASKLQLLYALVLAALRSTYVAAAAVSVLVKSDGLSWHKVQQCMQVLKGDSICWVHSEEEQPWQQQQQYVLVNSGQQQHGMSSSKQQVHLTTIVVVVLLHSIFGYGLFSLQKELLCIEEKFFLFLKKKKKFDATQYVVAVGGMNGSICSMSIEQQQQNES